MGEVVRLQTAALDMAGSIDTLKNEVLKMEQISLLTKSTFHGGMYCREVFFKAGSLAIGKVHKKEHFFFVVAGALLISTDEGPCNMVGPQVVCSVPGTRRAVYAQTDVLCMTFHRTDVTTVEDAEWELVEDDPASVFGPNNTLKSPFIEALS